MQIPLEDAHEGLLELLIRQGVAEGIHWTVGIAEKVREHVEMLVGARRIATEAFDQRQHMIRRPAGDKAAQYKGDCAKRFACTILRFGLLSTAAAANAHDEGQSLLALEVFANGVHEVSFARTTT